MRSCRVIRWCFVHMHISRTPDNDGLPHSRKVGSLRIAAQHSVHPTGGSLRVFRQFAWLEVGSVKMALSRPTHQRVTQAVGQFVVERAILETNRNEIMEAIKKILRTPSAFVLFLVA